MSGQVVVESPVKERSSRGHREMHFRSTSVAGVGGEQQVARGGARAAVARRRAGLAAAAAGGGANGRGLGKRKCQRYIKGAKPRDLTPDPL